MMNEQEFEVYIANLYPHEFDLVSTETVSQRSFFIALDRQIRAEIDDHQDLIISDQINEEIDRLRFLRFRNFDRRFEHKYYTRYSNRIGVLMLRLKQLGFTPKPARRHQTKRISNRRAPLTLYEIYLQSYRKGTISLEQFLHYTREGAVEPPTKELVAEHVEILKTVV